MAENFLIEIREGSGEPGFIELRPGVELAPMGVGTEGAWRVRGAGVLGIHLYLYFDGRALFAQSADQAKPAVVNGRPVGGNWTPLTAPATIALGTARLFFRPGVEDRDSDRTIAQAAPSEMAVDSGSDEDQTIAIVPGEKPGGPGRSAGPSPGRPFQPGAFASRGDESTRFSPIGDDDVDAEATRVVPLAETLAGANTDTPEIGTVPVRSMGPAAQRASAVRPAAGVPWSASAPPAGRPHGDIPPIAQRPTSPDLERQAAAGDIAGAETLYQPVQAPGVGSIPPPAFPPPHALSGESPAFPPPYAMLSGEPPPTNPGGPQPVPITGALANAGPAAAGPTVLKPKSESRLAREWNAAPPFRKALYILLLPALCGAFWVIFADEPAPAAHRTKKPTPTTSASATGTASAAAGGTASAPSATASATPPSSGSAVAVQTPPDTTEGHGPSDTPPAHPTPEPPRTTPETTGPHGSAGPRPQPPPVATTNAATSQERMAADYVSTGQYDLAAQLYDQLAQVHPENPAFIEASRILRRKLDAGMR